VLHVDDEPGFAEMVATFVEREDERLTVETATSASEGLDRLANGNIDCVVSDYHMAGLNGIEFLEAVREEYGDLPFVLYTGNGSEEIASEAISAGVSGYLRKGSGTDQYAQLANRILNAEAALTRTDQGTLLRERERKLDRLQKRTQQLMHTKNRTETASVAVEAASDVLGASLNGVHLLDETGDTLEGIVMTDDASDRYGETLNYCRDHEPGSSDAIVWDVFERGEPLRIDDTKEYDPLTEEPLSRCVLLYPVGRHGVFIASRIEPNAFDETDQALFEVLSTSLTGALDRVERETTLQERNEQLERQNERLDEFASIVSHDLQNPLNVAAGRAALLQEECESDHLDNLTRAHDRMETLIDDLLTLARTGESAGDTEPVDLQGIVESAWRTVGTRAATLVVEASGTIRADRTRLRQLLENLIQNSVEHGSTSPASQARQEAVTVTVGLLPDGFYVADDGPGIPVEHRDRVFESGYTTDPDGTGFGTTIARQVAGAHDWQIHLTESDDGGARFEITGVEFL